MSKSEKFKSFCKYFIIFLLISFIGWVWETIYVSILAGHLVDRGFLFLPICPIYGLTILCVYGLIGTPRKPMGLLKHIKNQYVSIIHYI